MAQSQTELVTKLIYLGKILLLKDLKLKYFSKNLKVQGQVEQEPASNSCFPLQANLHTWQTKAFDQFCLKHEIILIVWLTVSYLLFVLL